MDTRYKQIVDKICDFIANNAPREGLLSISVVGSMADTNYEIEEVNDLDVFYIYEDVDQESEKPSLSNEVYTAIEGMNIEIVKRFSSNELEIVPFYKCGPYKPEYRGTTVIMIHNLIDTRSRWLNESPIFVLDKGNLYRQLAGVPSHKIHSINRITAQNVIKDKYGIRHCRSMIKGEKIDYRMWLEDSSGRIRTIRQKSKKLNASDRNRIGYDDNTMFSELLQYSVIRSSINASRSISGQTNFLTLELKNLKKTMNDFKDLDFVYSFSEALKIEKGKRVKYNRISSLSQLGSEVWMFLIRLEKYLKYRT